MKCRMMHAAYALSAGVQYPFRSGKGMGGRPALVGGGTPPRLPLSLQLLLLLLLLLPLMLLPATTPPACMNIKEREGIG